MEKSGGPVKVLRAPALKRGREVIPISSRAKLDRVLGLTVSNNAAFDCDPHSGFVAYPAGCVVVLYNVRKNKQYHILSSSKKTINSLSFSGDGKYLATGECGHQPHVRVWDVQEKCQIAEFQGHKYGINCVAFSPNLKYVVSVGSQHDMIVNVWDWKNNVKVASNKVSCKVKAISFAANGNYFVTVGNRHVKFWYLEHSRSAKHNKLEAVPLMGRSAILGDQRNNYFCDVACGKGKMQDSTYAITKSGLLCEFNDRRLLDKWLELRTTSANSISVGEQYIFVGCSSGVIRCFNPADLNFICTLPKSHYLGLDVAKGGSTNMKPVPPPTSKLKYPDTIAIAGDEVNRKVTCIYNDHSLYVWDIKDMKRIGKAHSFMYHSACIWGIETYPELPGECNSVLPKGTFLTCSSDDTIRFWNLKANHAQDTAYHRNLHSSELSKIMYIDSELTYLCDTDYNPSGSNDKVDTTYDGKNGVRCLRISPNGRQLASGDRSGNIRIHDLESAKDVCKVEAHDSEVLCLEYSKPVNVGDDEQKYLASASRDRLIHVFDVKQDYAFQQTLDDHSSSITAVRFVHNDNALQMISCGADKSIIFRKAVFNPHLILVREHHVVGKTTLYDMEVDNHQKHILTACQDRNIRVYSVNSGKQLRYFRGSQGEDGTLIKVVLDPSGTYLATSCTDKSLYLYDYLSGECLATMFGPSELVTGLTFTPDGQHLISVSGDGCIFVWKLPLEVTQTMLSKLMTSTESNSITNSWQDGRKPCVAVTKPVQLVENNHSEEFASVNNDLVNGNAAILTNNNNHESPLGYRFSVGQLPLWAKKQILDEVHTSAADKKLVPPIPPRGRWAQRVDGQGLVVRSYLDSDSVIPYPGILEEETSPNSSLVKEDGRKRDECNTIENADGFNDTSFEVSEDSMRQILNKHQSTEPEYNGSGRVTLRHTNDALDGSRKDRVLRPLSNLNSAIAMRLEDMDAEDERSDSEISEMVYYPVSEDGSDPGDGSYHVCANIENDMKNSLKPLKPPRPEKLSIIAPTSTAEHTETNSDEEDAGTPVDSDRSILSSLCISTENLERLGQREKFMRSNYESLEKEDPGEVREQDMDDRSFYRQSISAKFLAGLPTAANLLTNGTPKLIPMPEREVFTPTSKREELNRALSDAKKKLETVGFRGGLSSSKSIGDLQALHDRDVYRRSKSATPANDIRRATSMTDLSAPSHVSKRLFPLSSNANANTNIVKSDRDSAPLWDQSRLSSHENSPSPKPSQSSSHVSPRPEIQQNSNYMSRSISMSSLHSRSRGSSSVNKPSAIYTSPMRQSLDATKNLSKSSTMLKKHNLPSLPGRTQPLSIITTSALATDSSSDSSPTESTGDVFHAPRQRLLSSGDCMESDGMPNFKHALFNSKLKSQSEWNLKSSGGSQWNSSNPVARRYLAKLNTERNGGGQTTEIDKSAFSFLCSDPSSVPLSQELCDDLSETLKRVSSYTMQIYQRITLSANFTSEDKFQMSNSLAQAVWQAQQTLRPAMPQWSLPPSSSIPHGDAHVGSPRRLPCLGSIPNGDLSDAENPPSLAPQAQQQPDMMTTMALLQQYSDKLLSMVEQKIDKKQ